MPRRNHTTPLAQPLAPPPIWTLPPYFNDSSELLIRHLPEDFTLSLVTAFLEKWEATNIRYFGTTGRLRHIAIADFQTPTKAIFVMQKLHQIKLGKRRLVVELATDLTKRHHPIHETVCATSCSSKEPSSAIFSPASLVDLDGRPIRSSSDIPFSSSPFLPVNHQLRYGYPPANPSTLINIANGMAKNHDFYVQTLHTMNRMCLPLPFHTLRKAPKLFREFLNTETNVCPVSDAEMGSESESEIESNDGDFPSSSPKQIETVPNFKVQPRKKRKLHVEPTTEPIHNMKDIVPLQEFFDTSDARSKVPLQIMVDYSNRDRLASMVEKELCPEFQTESFVKNTGFGTFSSIPLGQINMPEEDCEFVTFERLRTGKITEDEMATMPAFRNYQPGSPCAKLYIKNLAKTVDDERLRFVFGRYVNWSSPREVQGLQIRVMQKGRMKGQAFVTLPSQTKAIHAREEVHGFILDGKALCVSFACSREA